MQIPPPGDNDIPRCRADQMWLRRRVTVEQAEAENFVTTGAFAAEPLAFGGLNWRWLELLKRMKDGDELWDYDTPQEDWDNFMGSAGFALVRDGWVIETLVCRMN